MFSATYPRRDNEYIGMFLNQSFLYVCNDGEIPLSNRIEQDFIRCDNSQKMGKLYEILRRETNTPRIIIFVKTKQSVQVVQKYLSMSNVDCVTLAS